MGKIVVRLDVVLKEIGKTPYWLSRETKKAQSTISNLVKGNTRGVDFETLELVIEVIRPLKPDLQLTDIIDYDSTKDEV